MHHVELPDFPYILVLFTSSGPSAQRTISRNTMAGMRPKLFKKEVFQICIKLRLTGLAIKRKDHI